MSLAQTLETVRTVDVAERVLLLQGQPSGLDTTGFRVEPQTAGPLDERIAASFDSAPGPVLLIGMDTPQVSRRVLKSVVDDEVSDAWFGAATDGGFWALGLRASRGDLVRGVLMSRADTGDRQLQRLHDAGLRTRMLPALTDVDRFEDAHRGDGVARHPVRGCGQRARAGRTAGVVRRSVAQAGLPCGPGAAHASRRRARARRR